MIQLKLKSKNVNFYDKFKLNHSEKIGMKNIFNTSLLKLYKIKKLINKQTKNNKKRQII